MIWSFIELERVVKIRNGGVLPNNQPQLEYELYSIPAYDRGTPEQVKGSDIKSHKTFVMPGDVLFSKINPRIPRVWIVQKHQGIPQISSTEFWPLICDETMVYNKYLRYLLLWPTFRSNFSESTEAATKSRSRIKPFQLLCHKIHLPPISEQRRITEILDQVVQLGQLRTYADKKSDRIVPSIFIKIFGDPITNPMKWPTGTLGEVSIDLRYGTSSKCETKPEGLPVLRIPNVINGQLKNDDLKYANFSGSEINNLKLEFGDILFVRTNGNRNYVGRCAVFDLQDDYLFASYLIRARLDQNKVSPKFIATILNSPIGRQAMEPFIRTTAGQSNISLKGLRQIPIILPPLERQLEFTREIETMENLRSKRAVCSGKLENLYNNLLHKAFTGDLTASWRKAHMKELLQEMEIQSKALAS